MDAVEYAREPRSKVMDAIKFIEERNRMCKSFNSLECKGCPAFNAYELSCAVDQESTMNATDQIAIVEKWSTAHPRKTPEQEKETKYNFIYDTTTNKICRSESDHEWECTGMSTVGTIYICKKCHVRKTIPYIDPKHLSVKLY